MSAEPLHLFVPVGASRVVWEFEISYSAEVSIQTLTYIPFADLQNITWHVGANFQIGRLDLAFHLAPHKNDTFVPQGS